MELIELVRIIKCYRYLCKIANNNEKIADMNFLDYGILVVYLFKNVEHELNFQEKFVSIPTQ